MIALSISGCFFSTFNCKQIENEAAGLYYEELNQFFSLILEASMIYLFELKLDQVLWKLKHTTDGI